ILAWLVDGFEAYREEGLRPPADVTDATKIYRVEMDLVGEFIAECCKEDKDSYVKFSEFKERFEKHTGERAPYDLGNQLMGKGYQRSKDRVHGRIYRGLRFAN